MNENSIVEINLDAASQSPNSKHHKKPPTLVYCGDGVLEEYSSEDEDTGQQEEEKKSVQGQAAEEPQVDPNTLEWGPWIKHYAATSASKGIAACDFMGEKLAWWFGITQPKYLYEIEEYKRIQQEELENDSDTEEIELKSRRPIDENGQPIDISIDNARQPQKSLASNHLFQA